MAREYNFWVYMTTNDHDRVLYIAVTNDLARRVSEHRTGEVPGFTADYRCRKLVYYEHTSDVHAAISREKQLKRRSRTKKATLIARMNPRWLDLGREILEQ
ncbi:MAG: GIY-YIG nuclease family protein [Chthoniobacterales bacterium]